MTIVFVLRELLTIIKHCKNEKQRMKLKFHFIPCLFSSLKKRKKRKDCQVHFHPSTNNFHPFSLIQYHQTNQINHNQTTMRMRRGKGENEHHQQPSNKSKTPSFNARVKRGQANYTPPTTRFSSIL